MVAGHDINTNFACNIQSNNNDSYTFPPEYEALNTLEGLSVDR